MIVELEILDMNKERVTNDEMIFDGSSIPVPNAGEDVTIDTAKWTIKTREFSYSHSRIKVTLWCEGPKQ